MVVCFIPKCSSNSSDKENKCHFFQAPKARKQKWIEITSKLRADKVFNPDNPNHKICSLHFSSECIVKQNRLLINGEWVFVDRFKWALKETAIPTIFNHLPKSLIPRITNERRQLVRVNTNLIVANKSTHKPLPVTPSVAIPAINCDEVNGSDHQEEAKRDTFKSWWLQNDQNFKEWKFMESDDGAFCIYVLSAKKGFPEVERSITIPSNDDMGSASFVISSKNISSKMITEGLPHDNYLEILTNFQAFKLCPGIIGFSMIKECNNALLKDDKWYSTSCQEVGKFDVCWKCRFLHPVLTNKLSYMTGNKSDGKSTTAQRVSHQNKSLKRTVKSLKDKLRSVRTKIVKLKTSIKTVKLHEVEERIKAMGIPFLMKSSILHGLKLAKAKSTKGMRYSSAWLMECLLVKIKSPSAYRHLRESGVVPFPHPSTLTKLISSQQSEYGFNQIALEGIKKEFVGKSQRDRQGVLIFDELQLRETLSFNPKSHKMQGFVDFGVLSEDILNDTQTQSLANHALVLLFRPYNSDWVQPIAAFATKNAASGNALKKVVFEAIIRLENVGAEVVSVNCDGSKPNKSFWNLCEIGYNKKYQSNKIVHPCDETRFLYFTSDVPHLFKCIRNHFLKYGLVKFDGFWIDFRFYERLYNEDKLGRCGIRMCPKLTESHINPNSFEKMKVSLATQLFSSTVAKTLKIFRLNEVSGFEDSEQTEKFTLIMNGVFDALNSRIPRDGLRKESCNYIALKQFLQLMEETVLSQHESNKDVHFASKETIVGLWVTVKSTVEILDYLTGSLGYSYVLTSKMNQDCLERFFGIIRAAGGGEDHPTVTNFIQLFRLLCLYTPVKRLLHGNVSTEDDMRILVEFEGNLRKASKTMQSLQKDRDAAIEDLIVERLILKEAAENIYEESESKRTVLDKNIIYYLAGFLCYKAKKLLSCKACALSLSVKNPEVRHDFVLKTLEFNYGSLHHPSKMFFSLITDLENAVCDMLESRKFLGDLILECLLHFNLTKSLELGCGLENHFTDLAGALVPYYITLRLHFYTKCKRNELGHGKATRNKRKQSKLSS